MRRLNISYFVKEGVRSIGSHGLMSFAAVCMVVACLLIMGSFSLVAVNADHMMGELEDENVFLAYIDESYTDTQITELRSRIIGIDNVAQVEFITKEKAKAVFLEGHENAVFLDVPDEVFRDRFSVHVKDIERYQETVNRVKASAHCDPAGDLAVHHREHHPAGGLRPAGGGGHYENVRGHQLLCALALCGGGADPGPGGGADRLFRPVGDLHPASSGDQSGQRDVIYFGGPLWVAGQDSAARFPGRGRGHWRGGFYHRAAAFFEGVRKYGRKGRTGLW